MASRGSVAKNGHIGTEQYGTAEVLPSGAKVLEGKGNNHGLPDYSHSPNAVYVKYNASKTYVTVRFYGADHRMYLEIAYHPEPAIDKSGRPTWHYHAYGPSLEHPRAEPLTSKMAKNYIRYLEDVGYGTNRT